MLEFGVCILVGCLLVGSSIELGYLNGFRDGRKKTIERLFYGEADFRCYLKYRREQLEDGGWPCSENTSDH